MTSRPSYPSSKLDYALPPELIAQQPLTERTASRMLHVQRALGRFSDRHFAELPELLAPETLIVLNDSKVLPARLLGARQSGGTVEVLFLRWLDDGSCLALVGSNATLAAGEIIALPGGWSAELLEPKSLAGSRVRFKHPGGEAATLQLLLGYLRAFGRMPLPPYIKRGDVDGRRSKVEGHEDNRNGGEPQPHEDGPRDTRPETPSVTAAPPASAPTKTGGDKPQPYEEGADTAAPLQDVERYQTVYADGQKEGSSAAPTAGLHFDAAMLARLEAGGHSIARVTLHVGLGTFQPLKVDDLAQHEMHEEAFSIETEVAQSYIAALEAGRPVLAVGTTSLRVLHTLLSMHREFPDFIASLQERGTCSGMTRAFIYPGQDSDAATHLLTNFHLPRSTLLALVYSFGGEELMRASYQHAIERQYRFFSYGDCMLISRE